MDKIKILHITQVQGGIQTYIEQIYQNIDKRRFEIEIACPKEQKSLVKFARENNIKWHPIKLKWQISPFSDILSVFRIISLVKNIKPSIVHAHSSKAGFITRIAGVFFKSDVFYTPHAYAFLGYKGLKKLFFLNIERVASVFTDVLVVTSKSEYNRSVKEVKFSENKIRLFPNSIDIPEFTKINKGFSEKQIITTAGRLVYQKNPMMFLRICKLIKDKNIDVHFQIIGAGFEDRLKEEIDAYMKNNNMHDYVTIFNWMNREEFIEKLRKTDVFVMTSNFESFGYVAAEAQAIGVPVVSTNVDGLNEIVSDCETGFLIDVDDDRNMADKIIWLLKNGEEAKKIGQKGRERVIKDFNITSNIKMLENLYIEYSKIKFLNVLALFWICF